MRDKTVILLNSGGLDSFLAGKWLELKGYHIESLFINWLINGKEYNPELSNAAEQTARVIKAQHVVFPIEGNILFGQNNKFPHRPCCSSTMYYAIACAYAYNIGARYVSSGHMLKDKVTYEQSEYFEAINTLFRTHFSGKNGKAIRAGLIDHNLSADEPPIELLLPLFYVTSIAQFMADLGLAAKDLAHTYSCSFYPPCGDCFKCSRRARLGLT